MDEAHLLLDTEQVLQQIKKGAFLTVQNGDTVNTMTIGWATIGVIWHKPIFMVAVRPTRYTYTLIDNANNFTVSVPTSGMTEELAFCGTKSGREYDKFKECNLKTDNPRKVSTPIIRLSGRHYECRIVYKTPMDPSNLIDDYEHLYPEKDYHILYFGEIVDCYTTD